MEFEKVIKLRHSARSYGADQITDDMLGKILQAGYGAPVARGLYENYQLSIVQNEALLGKIAAEAGEAAGNMDVNPFYGAPTVIFVSGRKDASPATRMNGNAACIISQMHLAATDLGLGSVHLWGFIPVFNEGKYPREAGIPDGCEALAALAVGYETAVPQERDIPARMETIFVK